MNKDDNQKRERELLIPQHLNELDRTIALTYDAQTKLLNRLSFVMSQEPEESKVSGIAVPTPVILVEQLATFIERINIIRCRIEKALRLLEF